jgi:hypothetical protein
VRKKSPIDFFDYSGRDFLYLRKALKFCHLLQQHDLFCYQKKAASYEAMNVKGNKGQDKL